MENEEGGISLEEAFGGIERLAELFRELAESISDVMENLEKILEGAVERVKIAFELDREAWEELYILPAFPPPRSDPRKGRRWWAAVFGHYIPGAGEGFPKEGGENREREQSRRLDQKAARNHQVQGRAKGIHEGTPGAASLREHGAGLRISDLAGRARRTGGVRDHMEAGKAGGA